MGGSQKDSVYSNIVISFLSPDNPNIADSILYLVCWKKLEKCEEVASTTADFTQIRECVMVTSSEHKSYAVLIS